MTDAEIIKALECLMHDNCEDCPYYRDDCADRIKDPIELSKYALDLINRQQAENERLKYNLKSVLDERADHTDAIKEFAERLKLSFFNNGYESPDVDFDYFIDNLVKEYEKGI